MDGMLVPHTVGMARVVLFMEVRDAPETRPEDQPHVRLILPTSVSLMADLQEDGRLLINHVEVAGRWRLKDGQRSVYEKEFFFDRPAEPDENGFYATPEWVRVLVAHHQKRLDLLGFSHQEG